MADCRVCNAPITWAVDAADVKIPLDDHEQLDAGPGRYRIVRDGTPALVQLVPEESPVRTYVDHRVICHQPRAV